MTFEGKTVGNIVEKFVKKYKDKLDEHLLDKKKERLSSQMLILLNGKNVRTLKNYKTKLQEGDKLYFSYPISGG
jgi:molybdopterin converting factor small subunit